ncbi:hypothetical protein BDBG_04536 [Blastomyces gilchristii SLH14081]|uniref:Uncharacterized protein n=1 Tax=Blastomyces gilchristii (strain SLH14081) TaxID=559298 RepID=A0A179UMA4_BLAGS|nr:uncharacterized protein BDBG_04536 [Blastomyces gilchristii SLH14081]OAT08943.1 hypothetical protein BDBG_04536 [Blastomyces gilchristii SLH14081]
MRAIDFLDEFLPRKLPDGRRCSVTAIRKQRYDALSHHCCCSPTQPASNLPASVVFGFFSPPSSPTHPKSTSPSASASASTPTAHANIPLSGISDKFYSTRSLYASCEDHLPRAPAIVDFHCQPRKISTLTSIIRGNATLKKRSPLK